MRELKSRRHLRLIGAVAAEDSRPRTRGECVDGPRPCPFVSCQHHLLLDVTSVGSLKINFPAVLGPDDEPDLELLVDTCALDVADRGPTPLAVVAERMNVVRERVRQIEETAMAKARDPLSTQGKKLREFL